MNYLHEQAKILGQSDLPLDNVTVKDQLYKDGLQAHRTIFFHDLETTVSNNKDKVLSRIDILIVVICLGVSKFSQVRIVIYVEIL